MLYWSCSMSMRSERTEYRICSNNARSSRIGHRLDGPQRMINWNQALGARREGLVSPLLVKTAHDCLLLSPGAIIVEQEAIRRSHDSFPGLNLRGERAQTRLDGAVFQHPANINLKPASPSPTSAPAPAHPNPHAATAKYPSRRADTPPPPRARPTRASAAGTCSN